ncbi:thiamine phosphate synthase [Rosistilla oblonga]|uniref:thiamine phosphate synthase n=1 Tax=Rosistilla oblonga TaxID=2527990 RepID=UPI003A96E894
MDGKESTASGVWRILDASLNRASEGLRTIEEYARFVLGDPQLSEQLKQLRHQTATAAEGLPRSQLLAARDTPGDVGTAIETPTETERVDALAVAIAAAARVQQSLRCLEEYGKIVDSGIGRAFEACRYRSYTLFATLEQLSQRRDRLADCQLYVLVDGGDSIEAMTATIAELAGAGADLIQLRDKRLNDRELYEHAAAAAATLRPSRCLFIVNDRPDIAAAVHADGVHVGQDELPATVVRQIIGPERLLGVSTHCVAQVERAVSGGADYIGCGPTFPSGTKSFEAFPGTDFLRDAAATTTLPSFAIGGIGAENLEYVLDAGFSRVAVAGAITRSESPAAMVTELKQRLLRQDESTNR